ncbi:MAG: hypothetical protein VXZ26_00145, partial [Pseudomonadota bacterium]|nr:hypothetical protein [Pseudomonadota bacterium]
VGLFHMVVERASPMAIYSTFPHYSHVPFRSQSVASATNQVRRRRLRVDSCTTEKKHLLITD